MFKIFDFREKFHIEQFQRYVGSRGWALTQGRALIRGNTLLRNFGGKLWGMRKWQIADRLPLVGSTRNESEHHAGGLQ